MRPRIIVIVGGGIAGLAAASELLQRGCQVTVLEAKDRLGGRIHTIRQGRIPIELGAEFIHGKNPALLQAIKSAGLTTLEMPDKFQVWQKDGFSPVDVWTKLEKLISKVNFRTPDCPFEKFLQRQKLDPSSSKLAETFAEGFNAARVDRISAHSIRRAQDAAQKMQGDWQGRVKLGYGALIEFYEQQIVKLGGRIIKRAETRLITWKPGHVRVKWQRGPRKGSMEADSAVLTMPLGVWKAGSIQFEPGLKLKTQAIQELEFGDVLKPVLLFKRRWWDEKANSIMQAPDEPLPVWWADPRGPVLTAWVGGSKCGALRCLSPARLETLCLRVLAKLFDERSNRLRKEFVRMHCHRWEDDPHVRGAYSYIPVNGMELPKILAEPIADTLFFAGEATALDAQMGTVFGALESGLRAAHELTLLRH
jgi:monoamine oxidase